MSEVRSKINNVLCVKSSYSCQILFKLEFSRHIFRKLFKCQISWKSVPWEQSFSMRTGGQTDRQTWWHWVGLLWTSNRPDAETSTVQQPHEKNFHNPAGIRTRNPSKRATPDPHLRPRGHRDWRCPTYSQFSVYTHWAESPASIQKSLKWFQLYTFY